MVETTTGRNGWRAMGGSMVTSHARPSRSFDDGRVCRDSGCRTVLSVYNSGDFCSVHQPPTPLYVRGVKVA